MKTIGLIGGMSWESTALYYRLINEGIKARLGKLHSAKIALYSVDFETIEECQREGRWDDSAEILVDAAKKVEAAGADFLMICTNTMHKVYNQVEEAVSVPLIHIADATGKALVKNNINRVGLLGTQFTMQQDFYKKRLSDNFDLEVMVPCEQDQAHIHRVIYDELCLGQIKAESKKVYLEIIDKLANDGAQAIVLGCTEIGMLVSSKDSSIPLYDTSRVHAAEAVEFALNAD